MITQRETLVDAARAANIDVPSNLYNYDKSEFPFWNFYCLIQIDRPMPSANSHYYNARIVADIKPKLIADMTFADVAPFLE